MAKKIVHSSIKGDGKSRIPGGTPSCAAEAVIAPQPIQQPRTAVTPRQDPGNQGMFHRGAARVWNKVRPRATRSG